VTVGFFSPLPPAPTGVADYAAALSEALGTLAEVRVGDAAADICLYHLGNNPLHREVYLQALARPGIAVLHDAVLDHFFLGTLSREEYVEEFVYNYGEFERDYAARLWDARGGSAQDPRYFVRPMVRRIAEASLAVVVHNPAAVRIVREHAPAARVVEIPHLFVPRTPSPRPGANQEFTFGVFGHLRESKRLAAILRAFARVHGARLLVAGDFVSKDLERALAPMLAAPGVRRVPYVAEAEFEALVAGVDACIALRDPSAGETSGIVIRSMGLGKPVLMSAGEETEQLPEDAVIRIDRGLAEEPLLVEYMVWLVEHPENARMIGRRAAVYIAEHHGVDRAARLYFELLSSCCR
jgi:glycosyltransferase involved in cell wall biosynthesis